MTALFTVFIALAAFAADADSLATARDLYASAAYEDALAVLNRLPPTSQSLEETRAVEQYRALCLVALGRTAEAEHAIETVVAGDPGFRPATDVSPRMRTMFSEVRKRMLPAIIQKKYNWAKSAYDRKEFAAAAAEFSQVLLAMTDPDVEAAASKPPLSDLRTLAAGFRDLAETAAAPPPPPPPPPAAEPAPSTASIPAAPRVFTSADTLVLPPTVIRQELPPFPGQMVVERTGMIEVVIDEQGLVESAKMTQPVSQRYDALAVAAAKNWRYRPAMLNGVPVKYRKAVQVSVKAQR
jgi:TonB family protein